MCFFWEVGGGGGGGGVDCVVGVLFSLDARGGGGRGWREGRVGGVGGAGSSPYNPSLADAHAPASWAHLHISSG